MNEQVLFWLRAYAMLFISGLFVGVVSTSFMELIVGLLGNSVVWLLEVRRRLVMMDRREKYEQTNKIVF